MYDVIIIGCGVIGAAAAFELSKYRLSVAVLEKENDVSLRTSKANSAIIHAGYDPEPQTLMAKLNARGSELIRELAPRLCVPYRQTGSMVLGFDGEDMKTLRTLYERGIKNGVPELALLSGEEARALEPNLSENVKGALLAPTAAVISPWGLCIALCEVAVQNGVRLFLNREVTAIQKTENGYRVTAGGERYEGKTIVNASGVDADTVHNLAASPTFTITPSKGQYYLLDKSEGGLTGHVLFQCPTKHGKGVLVAPTVHGNLLAGPNAEDIADTDDTATTADGLSYVREQALRSLPKINFSQNIRNFAGVRANSDRGDFIIEEALDAPGFIDLSGIKSPGLSCALSIAEEAVKLLKSAGLSFEAKAHPVLTREKIDFHSLSIEEKNALIKKDPRYGRIICRCEGITEGEIVEALHSPVEASTIDGVKRRTNAGMGRCQGGFCSPRVQEIIARERGVPLQSVELDRTGSVILVGETKEAAELD